MKKEIDLKDVPQLIREGALEFGKTKIEFYIPFHGFRMGTFEGFDHCDMLIIGFLDGGSKVTAKSFRFPETKRPDLRDGDPVVVWNYGGSLHRRHVKVFEHALNGKIATYPNGLSLWSDEDCGRTIWDCWRLPTKEELSRVGCSEAQITEMFTRWGV